MRINIVTSLNDRYTKYACVMLTSLMVSQNPENEIHVFLMHQSLTEENKGYLNATVEGKGGILHFLQVDDSHFSEFGSSEQWSSEAYFRLLLVDLLPSDIDRLLYLDVDTIVNKPIDEMYFADFGDIEIIGQADANQPPFGDNRDVIFSKWIDQGNLTYCCSGVTLWNLELMRKKYTSKTYFDLAKALNYSMVAPDQDLLNYVHQEHFHAWEDLAKYGLFAKYAYNHDVHYEEVKDYSAIIHFAGQKPWLGQYVHYDTEQLWWDYAKLTPFYTELMEDFLHASLSDPLIYNALAQSLQEKEALQAELAKSVEINKKLLSLINGTT